MTREQPTTHWVHQRRQTTSRVTPSPPIPDQSTFESELDVLRTQEKAHTKASEALAAARRRLPMVAVDGGTPLVSARGG